MERRTFYSPYESFGDYETEDYNGQKVTVLGEVPDSEKDPEIGPMFYVRFDDGVETMAFEEELGMGACLDGGELWPHPDLDDADIPEGEPYSTWEEWAKLTAAGLV